MTAVDQFQAETEAVATATEREVVGIYTQLAAGLIAREAAVLLIAAAVNRANAVAVTLGDVWLAVQIEELAGQPVPTVGIAPRDHSERLVKAARTILFDDDTDAEPVTNEEVDEDSNDGPIGRLTRLARANRWRPRNRPYTTPRRHASPAPRQGLDAADGRRSLPTLCQWWCGTVASGRRNTRSSTTKGATASRRSF